MHMELMGFPPHLNFGEIPQRLTGGIIGFADRKDTFASAELDAAQQSAEWKGVDGLPTVVIFRVVFSGSQSDVALGRAERMGIHFRFRFIDSVDLER